MKVLIINGHPKKDSFNHALSEAYRKGAEANGAEVKLINISDLKFDPNYYEEDGSERIPEPDLVEAIRLIKEADHQLWTYPVWWYGFPAMMKAFIDRAFISGEMYEYKDSPYYPEQLLKGKTARLFITSDTPVWYDRLFFRRPAMNQMKRGTLRFCGIKKVKVTNFNIMKTSSDKKRANWLLKAERLGARLN